MKSAKLQTNLLGRHVHLLTDEEARAEAKKQEVMLEPEVLAKLRADLLYPALKDVKQRFGDQTGEIMAVHIGDGDRLIYTISFGGELVQLQPVLWRLDLT